MNTESKRMVITIIRRIIFSGITLFVVWLLLLRLRTIVNKNYILYPWRVVESPYSWMMAGPIPSKFIVNGASLYWPYSVYNGAPVSAIIRQNLGSTMVMMVLLGMTSLVSAGILLTAGVFIRRKTKNTPWLTKFGGILRILLENAGAGVPVFVISACLLFFVLRYQTPPFTPALIFQTIFFCSLPLTWLLVQTGYKTLNGRMENISGLKAVRDVGINLFIRLLKMAGFIIVIMIFVTRLTAQPGLGREFYDSFIERDYPVIFGIAWFFVIIVTVMNLAADLIRIVCRRFITKTGTPVTTEKPIGTNGIHSGWQVFCLGLCAFLLLVAVFGPLLAHNGNQIRLLDILQPPSLNHWLGTDLLGRDILSQLIYGIRTDVLIGLAAGAVVCSVAWLWSLLAFYGKRQDSWRSDTLTDIVKLPHDIIGAFPWLVGLLLLMFITTNHSLIYVGLMTGLLVLPRAAGMMSQIGQSPPHGKTGQRGFFQSITPVFFFTAAGIITGVATLGYLGTGLNPGVFELGSIINNSGLFMPQSSWVTLAPMIILSIVVIIFLMTGDALAAGFNAYSLAVRPQTIK